MSEDYSYESYEIPYTKEEIVQFLEDHYVDVAFCFFNGEGQEVCAVANGTLNMAMVPLEHRPAENEDPTGSIDTIRFYSGAIRDWLEVDLADLVYILPIPKEPSGWVPAPVNIAPGHVRGTPVIGDVTGEPTGPIGSDV